MEYNVTLTPLSTIMRHALKTSQILVYPRRSPAPAQIRESQKKGVSADTNV
jgi:hypothetical protein